MPATTDAPHVQPTVHLNGDTAGELFRQQLNIKLAAAELVRALRAAWPHARNYPAYDTAALLSEVPQCHADKQLVQSWVEQVQEIAKAAERACVHIDEQGV